MRKLKPEDKNTQLASCRGGISTQAICPSSVFLTAMLFGISMIKRIMFIFKTYA